MGGFTLTGPTLVFSNRSLMTDICFCCGWHHSISQAVEDRLAGKQPAVLEMHDLPMELRNEASHAHLGSPLAYTVERRNFAAEAAQARKRAARAAEEAVRKEVADLERRRTARWGDGTLMYPELSVQA